MIRANRHVTPRGTPRVPSRAYVYERAADMRSTPHPDGRAGSVHTHASEAARAATQRASDPLRYTGRQDYRIRRRGYPRKSTPRDATNLLRAQRQRERGGERTRRSERATRKRAGATRAKRTKNKTKGRRHLPSPTSRRRISPSLQRVSIRAAIRAAVPRGGKEER